MAIESQGSKFFWSATTSLSTAVQVNEVTDFNGPGGAAAIIDISQLQSTAKEKLIGLRDEGQLSLTLNYNATDAGQVALIADRATRSRRKALIKLNDSVTHAIAFDAFCMQFAVQGAVDNKIVANAALEITGALAYTTA
jgi:hypothetical protein